MSALDPAEARRLAELSLTDGATMSIGRPVVTALLAELDRLHDERDQWEAVALGHMVGSLDAATAERVRARLAALLDSLMCRAVARRSPVT